MIGTPNWIAEREIIYAERNRRILEACKNYPSVLEPLAMGSGFLFDLKNHLAICMHAKVKIIDLFLLSVFYKFWISL